LGEGEVGVGLEVDVAVMGEEQGGWEVVEATVTTGGYEKNTSQGV
jgi:hypothetical protein